MYIRYKISERIIPRILALFSAMQVTINFVFGTNSYGHLLSATWSPQFGTKFQTLYINV